MMDATATGYDLTITPTDDRGNVGTSRILTVLITGRWLLFYVLSSSSIEFISLVGYKYNKLFHNVRTQNYNI